MRPLTDVLDRIGVPRLLVLGDLHAAESLVEPPRPRVVFTRPALASLASTSRTEPASAFTLLVMDEEVTFSSAWACRTCMMCTPTENCTLVADIMHR